MESKDHLFDNFINDQLAETELPVPAMQWSSLDAALTKKSFWHFGLKTFNIFYASLIGTFTLLSGFTAYYSYQSYKLEQTHRIAPIAPQAPTSNQQSQSLQQENQYGEEKTILTTTEPQLEKKNAPKNAQNRSVAKRKVNGSELQLVLPTDPSGLEHISKGENNKYKLAEMAVNEKIDTVVKPTNKSNQTKPKKIIYLTKRDTIFKADTVRRVRRK